MFIGCCVCAILVLMLPFETKDSVWLSDFVEAEESRAESSLYCSVDKVYLCPQFVEFASRMHIECSDRPKPD